MSPRPSAEDEAAAYQAALRQAFRSVTPLEPAIVRQRSAPEPEAARDATADAPVAEPEAAPEATAGAPEAERGRPGPRPALAPATATAATSMAVAPDAPDETDAVALQTVARVARPSSAAAPPAPPTPKTRAPSSRPPASPPGAGPSGKAGAASRAPTSKPATPDDPPHVAGLCPTCGRDSRARVRTRAVVVLVLVGLIVGTIGGALIAGAAGTQRPVELVETPTATPSVAATPAATLEAGVAAGFLQVAAVNDRLARAAANLETALAAKRPSAADVAPLLRRIAADARSGQEGSARVGAWRAAGAFPADAAALYSAAAAVAADGLGAPLTDNAAYKAAGKRMLRALDSLPAIAAATRDAAARAGVTLPEAAPAP